MLSILAHTARPPQTLKAAYPLRTLWATGRVAGPSPTSPKGGAAGAQPAESATVGPEQQAPVLACHRIGLVVAPRAALRTADAALRARVRRLITDTQPSLSHIKSNDIMVARPPTTTHSPVAFVASSPSAASALSSINLENVIQRLSALEQRVARLEDYQNMVRRLNLPEVARVILAVICDWHPRQVKDKRGITSLKGGALHAPMHVLAAVARAALHDIKAGKPTEQDPEPDKRVDLTAVRSLPVPPARVMEVLDWVLRNGLTTELIAERTRVAHAAKEPTKLLKMFGEAVEAVDPDADRSLLEDVERVLAHCVTRLP